MSGLQKDMQRQKGVFLQGAAGMQHPACKRYRKMNDRVTHAVAAYGRAEILIYLRLPALRRALVTRIEMNDKR